MNYPPERPAGTEPANKAFIILRIFLWLMPAIFIPAFAMAGAMLINPFRGMNGDAAMVVWIVAIFIAPAAVGYFDQRISLMQKKIAPPHNILELVRWTIIFVLLQIIIAPAICFTALYGFCLVAGSAF